jgi:glucokinase
MENRRIKNPRQRAQRALSPQKRKGSADAGTLATEYVLAVDLGGTKVAAAVVDRAGKVSRRESVAVDGSSAIAVVKQIVELGRELVAAVRGEESETDAVKVDALPPSLKLRRRGASSLGRSLPASGQAKDRPLRRKGAGIKASATKSLRGGVVAAGVAVPGMVRRDGTVWAPNLPGWERMGLAKFLREAWKIPVVVESDRNAAVLGETWRGAARGKSDAIVLMLGTGIGAGILSGGRLVRGAHELSGCAGWMVLTEADDPGAKNVGQLEWLAAGPGIARAAREELARGRGGLLEEIPGEALNAYEVAEAARKGDVVAIEVFLEAGRVLGYGVANLVSLFDPEVVVIGGGLARAADLFLDALKKGMAERAQPLAGKMVKVMVSELGEEVNLVGVGKIAWGAGNSQF